MCNDNILFQGKSGDHRYGGMPTYASFDLLIGSGASGQYPITVVHSPAGETNGVCELASDDFALQDALLALQSKDVDGAFLEQLGQYLFEELFTGDVETLYRTSLGMVRNQDSALRLHLRMEPPELAALPWEYLFDPVEDRFLAVSTETVVVRYVPMRLPIRSLKVTPPLRILAVAASPADLPPLAVDREMELLGQALSEQMVSGRVQLNTLGNGTMASISEAMRSFQPHVLHFVGHGLFMEGQAHLALEGDDGAAVLVDERMFRETFAACRETRLVVLNACESGVTSAVQPLVGMAPRLLQRQVSAVVAMQAPFQDEAALHLGRVFYRSVALGFPVDAAIAEARRAIFLELGPENGEWGVPVLFMRAQDGQLFALSDPDAAEDHQIPAPPQPIGPPDLVDFVGREAELAYFAQALANNNLAVIQGMAGVGKTALAVALLNRQPEARPVFWHSFRQDEGVDTIVWKAAGWLAWQGQDDLWRMLQNSRQQGNQLPSETLLDYLLQLLSGHDYLICLDDLNQVDTDPLSGQLVERLQARARRAEVSLIITTRHLPDFIKSLSVEPLAGLSSADTQRLLSERQIRLPPDQVTALHQTTGGNAELLNLATNLLQGSPNPAHQIERLDAAQDIEHYLLAEIDAELDAQERDVMAAVAILQGHPGSRDALEVVLDSQQGLRRTLSELSRRHLLLTADGPTGRLYSQHAIVQAFYYSALSRRQRQIMHGRAGDYYEFDEEDLLKAARHHDLAGNHEHGARLAVDNVATLINQGEARSLYALLQQLAERRLSAELALQVLEATGDVAYLLGELKQAASTFQRIEAKAGDALTQARRRRKLGEIQARLGTYETALTTFQQGRDTLASTPTTPETQTEDARLAVGIGTVLLNQGQYDEALAHVQTALDGLNGIEAAQPVADLHDVLGKVHYFHGDFPAALAQFQAALALRQDMQDQRGVIRSYSNLAVVYGEQARYAESMQANEEALKVAEQIGDMVAMATLYRNIAVDYAEMELFNQATDFNKRSLALAEQMGNVQGIIYAHHNLGDVYRQQEKFAPAIQHLSNAMALAEHTGEHHMVIAARTELVEVYLQQGRLQQALEACQRVHDLASRSDSQQRLPQISSLLQEIKRRLQQETDESF